MCFSLSRTYLRLTHGQLSFHKFAPGLAGEKEIIWGDDFTNKPMSFLHDGSAARCDKKLFSPAFAQ
jgi:hypothetical protein